MDLHPPHVVETEARVAAGHAGLVDSVAAEHSVLTQVGVDAPDPVTRLHEVLPNVGAVVGSAAGGSPGGQTVVVQSSAQYPAPGL